MIAEQTRINPLTAHIVGLHLWFTSMRSTDGFGGPVSHWWRSCLQFTGTGLDWRYEGIITGYLALFERSGSDYWLRLAQQAGDDLVAGQTSSANFVASSFELNPYAGGNPGEAACDVALLDLAKVLQDRGDDTWERYFNTAERNIRDHYMARMWDNEAKILCDGLDRATFVPNKAATMVEALFRHAAVTDRSEWVERFALPNVEAILRHQVNQGDLQGAIYQYGHGGHPVEWFFPYYIARCVPALADAYRYTDDERFRDGALRALEFILRWRYEDGSFPQVIYAKNRTNRYPQWIAGSGDMLRAMAIGNQLGMSIDLEPAERWLLDGVQANGSIRTARGFAAQTSQKLRGSLPEFRDVMPVCGWADKAFRYLAERLEPGSIIPVHTATQPVEADCTLRGARCTYRESDQAMELWQGSALLYRWRKGDMWAEVNTRDLLWK